MLEFVEDHLTDEEIERVAGPSGALAASVRELIDAVVRTEVETDELDDVRHAVDELAARLRRRQLPGSFGTRFSDSGEHRTWGNAVVGLRNPIAPPMSVEWEDDGRVVGHATLGAAYEGPSGFAHGGVAALMLDQVMGAAAHAAGRPGMTVRLTLKYSAPTPLGPIRAEAKAVPSDEPGAEFKTTVLATLYSLVDGEETVCAEADGLFVLPKMVRERFLTEGR